MSRYGLARVQPCSVAARSLSPCCSWLERSRPEWSRETRRYSCWMMVVVVVVVVVVFTPVSLLARLV